MAIQIFLQNFRRTRPVYPYLHHMHIEDIRKDPEQHLWHQGDPTETQGATTYFRYTTEHQKRDEEVHQNQETNR